MLPRFRGRRGPERGSAPGSYYDKPAEEYTARRNKMPDLLIASGFRCCTPYGAYYVMTGVSAFGFPDDAACVRHMIHTAGVAAVPGSSFFAKPAGGASYVRFCFC